MDKTPTNSTPAYALTDAMRFAICDHMMWDIYYPCQGKCCVRLSFGKSAEGPNLRAAIDAAIALTPLDKFEHLVMAHNKLA